MAIRFQENNTLQEIRKEMHETKDGRYLTRLSMIEMLIKNPNTKVETITEKLMISTATIYSWINTYHKSGLEGLKRILRNGGNHNRSKIDSKIFDTLLDKIDKQDEYWSAPKMREWIEKKYSVIINVETIRYHLKKRGYSYTSARPSPSKGDRDAQGRFKKVD